MQSQGLAAWFCDTTVSLLERIRLFSDSLYDYNKQRSQSFAGPSSTPQDELMRETAYKATMLFFDTFYNEAWPSYLDYIMKKLLAATPDANGLCRNCGHPWDCIGCAQHVLCTCPFIQSAAMESFEKHGPGTETNIQCDITDWLAYVRIIGSNPLQLVDGIQMQVRFAYIDEVVRNYVVKAYADLDLQRGRLNFVPHKEWKHVLNEYKYMARNRFFGSAERMFASRRET